jgi:FMN phosphatase YigB (HAD superfamily)
MKAIIFDLDGTLLPMDTNQFMKLYAQAVTEAFYDFKEAKEIFPQIMASLEVTIKSTEKRKNFDTFFEDFDLKMPHNKEEYILRFNEFYESGFEKVKEATSVSDEIVEAVSILKEKGYKMIIATNPIFPMAANLHRIKWAGLDVNDFIHVTSFENNHFCKPNPKFYEEVLFENKLLAEDVMMVGNDVQEDLCIKSLGAKTYLVNDYVINRKPNEIIQTDHQGSYQEFLEFVKGL